MPQVVCHYRYSHFSPLELRAKSKWFGRLWVVAEALFVSNPLQVSSKLRVAVLRMFGAKIGRDVGIANIHVNLPWNLTIGDRCWIGEQAWFHCSDKLVIGNDTVISQGTFITTGSHDIYNTMDRLARPVTIGAGVWITSKCIVTMGVDIGDSVVVTPGSVVNKSLAAGGIYRGNPAVLVRDRWTNNRVQ